MTSESRRGDAWNTSAQARLFDRDRVGWLRCPSGVVGLRRLGIGESGLAGCSPHNFF